VCDYGLKVSVVCIRILNCLFCLDMRFLLMCWDVGFVVLVL